MALANHADKKSFFDTIRLRLVKVFKDAMYVGNYLTGYSVLVESEGTTSWVLTDDNRHVKGYIIVRKSIKFKFAKTNTAIEDNHNDSSTNQKLPSDETHRSRILEDQINKTEN